MSLYTYPYKPHLSPAPTPMSDFFVPPMAMGEDPQKYYEKLKNAYDKMYKAYQDAVIIDNARKGNPGLRVFASPRATEITLSEYNAGLQDLKRRMESIQKLIEEESNKTQPSPVRAAPPQPTPTPLTAVPLTAAPPAPTAAPSPAPQPVALSSSSGTTSERISYTAAMTSKSTGSQTQTKTQTQAPVWKPSTSRINLRTGRYIT